MTTHHRRVYGIHFTYGEGPAEKLGADLTNLLIVWAARHRPQLTQYAYPGQPSTRTRPPVRPCCCQYMVIHTPDGYVVLASRPDWPAGIALTLGSDVGGNLETHLLGPTRCPIISLFQISDRCPHHGYNPYAEGIYGREYWERRYLESVETMWRACFTPTMRDRYDLDDDERRG